MATVRNALDPKLNEIGCVWYCADSERISITLEFD